MTDEQREIIAFTLTLKNVIDGAKAAGKNYAIDDLVQRILALREHLLDNSEEVERRVLADVLASNELAIAGPLRR